MKELTKIIKEKIKKCEDYLNSDLENYQKIKYAERKAAYKDILSTIKKIEKEGWL